MSSQIAAPEAPAVLREQDNHFEDGVAVAREIELARQAQAHWAARPLRERIALVRRFRHLIPSYSNELAAPIHPQRRLPGETLGAEVLPFADACRFLERKASSILKPYRLGSRFRPLWLFGVRSEIHREPFGVVLLIGPSNYPLFLTGSQAMQALAAGNAVILKPGTGGGETARVFARLLGQAGMDPRLLRVLPETPEAAQQAIAAGVDKVLLTGSARTGASVLAQLAPHLVPAAMELSGYDAAFIRNDANLDLVTRALRFGFRLNHGETCIAPHRVFVSAELAPELRRRLAAMAEEFQDRTATTAAARRAAELVSDAVERGARVIGGRVLPHNQGLTPTVVAGVTADMPLVREETFAPVLSIVEVRDDEDALRIAALCPFALGASVFGDPAAARALARRINAGIVVINDVIAPTADPRLPFGGRGHSGFGVTRGTEGLLELTTVKVITTRHGRNHWHFDPPDAVDGPLFDAFIRASHAPSWRQRVGAWFKVVRLFLKKGKSPQDQPAT
jgi:acyl-CoA reductase-like NAD-dependent aldehyde dehydrogenase